MEQNGVYFYNFAVEVRGNPPPGTVQLSRMDSVDLVLDWKKMDIWSRRQSLITFRCSQNL